MSKIYMAVTVCQDRNKSIFKPRENAEYSPGYYSYVFPCKAGENLKFALDCIGGLQCAHLCSTKREAAELVEKYGVMQAPTLIVVKDGKVTKLANASNIKNYAEKEG